MRRRRGRRWGGAAAGCVLFVSGCVGLEHDDIGMTGTDSATTSVTATDSGSTSWTTATTAGTDSATSGSTSATGTWTGSTTGTKFDIASDGGDPNECDPQLQDCIDGEKCTAWADDGGGVFNANKCVPHAGTGGAGDPCTTMAHPVSGLDDCDEGLICLGLDDNLDGTCVAFCEVDGTCAAGTLCVQLNGGVLPICIAPCDPLAPDCPNKEGCYADASAGGVPVCMPDMSGKDGKDGDSCDDHDACDPGLACAEGTEGCMTTSCCTPWCDLKANTCMDGEECVPHFVQPPAGFEDLGVCVLP